MVQARQGFYLSTLSLSTTRVAIIGGTGFEVGLRVTPGPIVETKHGKTRIDTGLTSTGNTFFFLPRHGQDHGIAPHRINHRANIAALRALETTHVLATTAVGSLRISLAPTHLVVPDDLIDWTGEVTTFFDSADAVRHTDMAEPYSLKLRTLLIAQLECSPITDYHKTGTYVSVSGPRYETPAEIRMFAQLGGDIIGMTSAPEAILCRELGIHYGMVSVVTNYGCGLVADQTLDHGHVQRAMLNEFPQLASLLLRCVDELVGPNEQTSVNKLAQSGITI